MAHTPLTAPRQAPPDTTQARQIRRMLQDDLRALAIPSQDSHLAEESALSAEQPGKGRRLGDYLCAHGLITEHELVAALTEQQRRLVQGAPIALGDLLVEQGRVRARELVTVLMLQQLDRLQEAAPATPRLGELLVQSGLISAEQLATALTIQTAARQQGQTIHLGYILIARGILTRHDLATTLAHQRRIHH